MFESHKEGGRGQLGQGWAQGGRERKVRSRLDTRREGEGRFARVSLVSRNVGHQSWTAKFFSEVT